VVASIASTLKVNALSTGRKVAIPASSLVAVDIPTRDFNQLDTPAVSGEDSDGADDSASAARAGIAIDMTRSIATIA
jgi:hypothetical protein